MHPNLPSSVMLPRWTAPIHQRRVFPDNAARDTFHDYMHLRDNPAGIHRELWYHEQGDRSWLVVTRDTISHAVISVELARERGRK